MSTVHLFRVGVFFLMLSSVMLSGCSTWNGWFSDDESELESADLALNFVEPTPEHSVPLNHTWRLKIAGSADEHRQHPGQLALSGDALFIGTFQGHVVSVSQSRGDVLWDVSVGATIVGGVAINETQVFAGTRDGEMISLSRADGHEMWRVRVSTVVASAPLVADGKVIFTTLDNRTYALSVEDGKRIWFHATAPEALVVMGAPTPALDGHQVYVGYASGEVFSLSLTDGQPLWSENLSSMGGRSELDMLQDVDAGVVVPDATNTPKKGMRKIYTVNHQGRAVAIYPGTGVRIWEQPLSAVRRPLLVGQQLFISDIDGNLVALSAEDGLELWRIRLSDGLLTAPVLLGDRLLVSDDKGRFYNLDKISGKVLGLDRLKEPVLADPVVFGNSLFLWSNEGNLHRYDP